MKGGERALLVLLLTLSATAPLSAQCPDGTPPPCRARAVPTPATNSVAVLYFDNLSSDTSDAYLADGLTEEITSRLGELPRLQIKRPGRDVVRRLRDTVPDYLVALGRILRVRYLVEGSVRRAGPRVRVSARLLGAGDGFRVWSADYDRAASDLPRVAGGDRTADRDRHRRAAVAEGTGRARWPRSAAGPRASRWTRSCTVA